MKTLNGDRWGSNPWFHNFGASMQPEDIAESIRLQLAEKERSDVDQLTRAQTVDAFLDSEEFYNLMQAYRWSDMDGHDHPEEAIAAFEAVKQALRKVI